MTRPRTGSCACGTVRFTLSGSVRNVVSCHCGKCRKLNGGAFSTYAVVRERDLAFSEGESAMAAYTLSSGFARRFCRRCGSPLYNYNPDFPEHRMVFLGALDEPQDVVPRMNIFCSSMLEWVPELASVPAFPGAFTPDAAGGSGS